MGDPRYDMMLLLSPSTSLDHLCGQPWTVSVRRTDIPGPVGLDLPVLLSLDGQCRPVSASRGIFGPVAVGDLRMVSSERVSPINCT